MSATVQESPEVTKPIRVEASLLPELRRFGAVDVAACFNCGTCSAICPMTTEDGAFPRRVIRLAQLGLREQLLASPELWTCFGCGECTVSCPRQADPAGFMAAARRYAVAGYDRTGLARRLATSGWFAAVFVSLLVGLLAAFLATTHRPVHGGELALFEFLPAEVVHELGIAVFVVFGLATVSGVIEMARRLMRSGRTTRTAGERPGLGGMAWDVVGREALGHATFRAECAGEPGPAGDEPRPWYRRRWFLHAATMWGFLGLLAATLLDYALDLTGVKSTGTDVPIWYPVRLLGTVAGALMVYGTSVLLVRRLRGVDPTAARSTVSDWTFLWMVWLAGVTGFVLEVALYLPGEPTWAYAVLLAHVAIAMALVLLAPFGKFAHAIYRPVGLIAARRSMTNGGT